MNRWVQNLLILRFPILSYLVATTDANKIIDLANAAQKEVDLGKSQAADLMEQVKSEQANHSDCHGGI